MNKFWIFTTELANILNEVGLSKGVPNDCSFVCPLEFYAKMVSLEYTLTFKGSDMMILKI
jgi:predicted patatin/cPLA2 family phospholipase